ncbi:MAG: methionyl-tRNA formyltransferase [Patescibacteria group bacterium]
MSNIIHLTNNLVNSKGILSPERSETESKGLKTKFYSSTSSGNKISPKIVFLGTPDFAVPILEKLINSDYKPVAVFCAPDKPVGRQQILTPPPVKIAAQKYTIPVHQPVDANELLKQLTAVNCDLVISAAFGLILPKAALDLPHFDCLNVHPSLLPKYRGASPIQATILNGDAETGVTIYKMDEQIDHGPILITEHLSLITKKYTTPELSKELAELSATLLFKTLPDWLAGKITPQPQDNSQATLTKIITKENSTIDWQKSAEKIEQQIRAYTPWPGSHTYYSSSPSTSIVVNRVEKSKLKIIEAETTEKNSNKQIGEVFSIDSNNLTVQTGQGALIIKKLQMENGKILSAPNFLRGHQDIIGKILR